MDLPLFPIAYRNLIVYSVVDSYAYLVPYILPENIACSMKSLFSIFFCISSTVIK